jgi:hypothetical protein
MAATVDFHRFVVGHEKVWSGFRGTKDSFEHKTIVYPLTAGEKPNGEFLDNLPIFIMKV